MYDIYHKFWSPTWLYVVFQINMCNRNSTFGCLIKTSNTMHVLYHKPMLKSSMILEKQGLSQGISSKLTMESPNQRGNIVLRWAMLPKFCE